MPNRIDKLRAYIEHLLDAFIRLRQRYAMLAPMIFDEDIVDYHGAAPKAYGFRILRNSLFLSCAQDIAKLCFDGDERSPSIDKLVDIIAEDEVDGRLKAAFTDWKLPDKTGDDDPEIEAALRSIELREKNEREAQYCELRTELEALWQDLENSDIVDAFRTVRDKVTAHTEIRCVADKYQFVDLAELDLKWGHLQETISQMQRIIEILNLLVRNASFAWGMLDEQLTEAGNEFWKVPTDAH